MDDPLALLFYGLGPIGQAALEAAANDPLLAPVGAVDIDPELVGRRLHGVSVAGTLADALAVAPRRPRAVVHATGSRITQVADQLRELVGASLAVSTSCEEMMFPWYAAPDTAQALDDAARAQEVCIYPTGVNPGYVLDRLPLALATVSHSIRRIHAERIVDSTTRRPQLQRKTGAGLSPDAFESRARAGRIGHVGLRESLEFLAAGLGRSVTEAAHHLEPVLATTDRTLAAGPLRAGQVAGAREMIHADAEGVELRLVLEIAAGSGPALDRVILDGAPPVTCEHPGGLAGEPATAAALIHGARRAVGLPPGIARL